MLYAPYTVFQGDYSMKKGLIFLTLALILAIYPPCFAQEKSPPKGEVFADSDSYVIGAEDVLLIHVWREEPLSRSIPVRMDGKISLPLIDEIEAAGLTPKQLKEKRSAFVRR
jgi:polysaccharide export outer membrane protein